jgi:hypothetical protein
MKISGLLFLIFIAACVQKPIQPQTVLSGDLNLLQLSSNPSFSKDESGNFESKNTSEYIRVYRHSFANQRELQEYILNRRMLLHKSFQDQIAPYFGLIQLNKKCLAKVDTKGEVVAVDKNEEFMKMSFPANDEKTLADCSTEKFWGSLEYHFHNCKKLNEVYELRISHREGIVPAMLRPRCL